MHLIISSQENKLQDIIRDLKKHNSKEFIKAIKELPESRKEWLLAKFSYASKLVKKGVSYKVWKDGYHPVILNTSKKLKQHINYLHYNLVALELVYHKRDWKNSSYAIYEEDNLEISSAEVHPLW